MRHQRPVCVLGAGGFIAAETQGKASTMHLSSEPVVHCSFGSTASYGQALCDTPPVVYALLCMPVVYASLWPIPCVMPPAVYDLL